MIEEYENLLESLVAKVKYKKIRVFRVTGLKTLGRVGTHIFSSPVT